MTALSPSRAVVTAIALPVAVAYGVVSAAWFFVAVPVLWLVIGVPVVVLSALVNSRSHTAGHLRRRLKRQHAAWRSRWRYHYAEIGWTMRRVRRRVR